VLATAAAGLAAALLGAGLPRFVGLVGAALLAAGALGDSEGTVGAGTALLCVGVLVTGVYGGSPARLVPATLCALFAWDVGRYGVVLGEQLGEGDAVRAELAHATLTATVGAAGAAVCYGAFRATTGDQPVAALALLFAGAVVSVLAVTE
jgi:hypothetical protein